MDQKYEETNQQIEILKGSEKKQKLIKNMMKRSKNIGNPLKNIGKSL